MGKVIALAAVVLALATAAPAASDDPPAASRALLSAAPSIERWRSFIAEAGRRFAVPEAWIAAVMQAESRGLTTLNGRPITSSVGAIGLMQVMPETYAAMRAQYHLGADPYNPHDNILAGAAYLRAMYQRFGYPGLFAAYNAGPARFGAYLRAGRPLPDETRAYMANLARAPAASAMPPAILSGTRLFFTLGRALSASSDTPPASPGKGASPASGGLFIPLTSRVGPGG